MNLLWLAAGLFVLLMVAVHRVDYLDVDQGLRDGNDGHGWNRGWHWPWTPIIQICFVGIIICVLGSL
jgi:hypothetical protein